MAYTKSDYETADTLYRFLEREGIEPPRHWEVMDVARELRLSSDAAHRWAEKECNGVPRYDAQTRRVEMTWTDEDDAQAQRAYARAESRVKAAFVRLLGEAGAARYRVEMQSDPRGAPFALAPVDAPRDSGRNLFVF